MVLLQETPILHSTGSPITSNKTTSGHLKVSEAVVFESRSVFKFRQSLNDTLTLFHIDINGGGNSGEMALSHAFLQHK